MIIEMQSDEGAGRQGEGLEIIYSRGHSMNKNSEVQNSEHMWNEKCSVSVLLESDGQNKWNVACGPQQDKSAGTRVLQHNMKGFVS